MRLVYGETLVGVEVVAGFTADFDLDVDDDDLIVWQGAYGPGNGADADADSDGADFLAWQQQLGSGLPATPAGSAVPEPASVLLSAAAGWGLAAVRRRGAYCPGLFAEVGRR